MKRVGVAVHATKGEAASTAGRVAAGLVARGVEVVALRDDVARIGGDVGGVDALDADLDLVLAFGGDGTLLRAIASVGDGPAPVMGVNLGHLGFLSALEDRDLDEAMDALAAGTFAIEERRLLRAHVTGGGEEAVLDALNDVIIEKRRVGRSIRLRVTFAGEPLVSWAADGLIIATSTGSTAYSFSAGGPVVSPRLACLIVTPVAPHGMFGRTVILPPDEAVTVDLAADSDPAALSPDGAPGVDLAPGARITARLGERTARLATIEPTPFWRLVREKFGLRVEED